MTTTFPAVAAPGAGAAQTAPAQTDAVILLAKGGYGDEPQRELDNMLTTVRAGGRYAHVEGAFIDSGGPAFPKVLRALVDRGARRIVIAPVFVPLDRSLREWLPKVVRRALKKQHMDSVEVVLAPGLGEHPAVGDVLLRALADAELGSDVRAGAPPRDHANRWLTPPPHAYHAFVCEGPRCATLGSHELFVHLRDRLLERSLSASGNAKGTGVLTVRSSCLYPCNLGPMMVVYPGGHWYGALSEGAVERIVDEHFGRGCPVEEHLRFRDLNAGAAPPADPPAAAPDGAVAPPALAR